MLAVFEWIHRSLVQVADGVFLYGAPLKRDAEA